MIAIKLQLRRGTCSIESIADAVLARDPAYPAVSVREYTAYILETSAGMR
jgi:hypothetical protein